MSILSRTRAFCALPLLFAFFGGAAPSSAQVYAHSNVVMLANEDLFSGYNDVWGFVGSDGREYIIQGLNTGTAWWDVDDPVHPVLVKTISAPVSTWRDMFVIGDYAYVGCENGNCGIQIIDISDPTDPVLAATYHTTVGQSHNIFGDASRNLLFVFGGYQNTINGGVQILDVSTPTAPVEISQWDNQYIHDATAEGDVLHVCLISAGRYRMLDISDSTNPTNKGTNYQDPAGAVHAVWPLGDGVHVAIAEETGSGHIKILDRSDSSNVSMVGQHNPAPTSSAHNVHVEGDKAYVSWYARGTRILDVSDPTTPTEIGFWDTYPPSDGQGVGPGNWGVYPHLPSGTIAANDGSHGLFLLKYDTTAGTIDGTVSSDVLGLLDGATVEFLDLALTQVTDTTGAYDFAAFPGAGQAVAFSAFGHDPDTITVTVPSAGTVTNHVVLTKQPAGSLGGQVTDAVSLLPLEGVEVVVTGTSLSAVTDSTGSWNFPDLPAGVYALDFTRYAYAPVVGEPATVVANQANSADIALEPGAVFADFSSTAGWTVSDSVGGGTPTGSWEFGEPHGTYSSGIPFNPELDHTLDPEDQCAVTGNAAVGGIGADDVDFLTTRLLSPQYDLSGMGQPHFFYYRWYAVNGAAEAFEVEATSDGGSNWTLLETTVSQENFWKAVDVDLTGLFSSYSQIQFRFTAQDPGNTQVVEAALDDVTIYDAGGAVGTPTLPVKRFGLELAQNAPNPWTGTTSIAFSIPSREHVQLSVFDVRGARVATVVDELMDSGPHRAMWNGRSSTGKAVAAGTYFYKLQTKSEIRTKKMVRLQ